MTPGIGSRVPRTAYAPSRVAPEGHAEALRHRRANPVARMLRALPRSSFRADGADGRTMANVDPALSSVVLDENKADVAGPTYLRVAGFVENANDCSRPRSSQRVRDLRSRTEARSATAIDASRGPCQKPSSGFSHRSKWQSREGRRAERPRRRTAFKVSKACINGADSSVGRAADF